MLSPNDVIQNRYQIVRFIGQGGVGAVYEALDLRLRNRVALKQLMLQGSHISKAFEREAQLLGNLRHPALPRVNDHFTDPQGLFLVMDYVPGDDLGVQIQQSGAGFPLTNCLNWSEQLLRVLEYLHNQHPPVLHRDIKPYNIKISPEGQVMLLDFGLAKGAIATQSLTNSRSVHGYTLQYSPLEQIQGTGTDPRSDLYALAATLYHLLTRQPPADALTRAAAVLSGKADPLVEPRSLNPAIPSHINTVLINTLSPNCDQRPASAKAMREMLHNAPIPISAGATTILHSPTIAFAPRKTASVNQSQRRPYLWVGSVLLLLIALAGGWWLINGVQGSNVAQTTATVATGSAATFNATATNDVVAVVGQISSTPTSVATTEPTATTQSTNEPTQTIQPTDRPTATTIPASATPRPDAVVTIASLNMREGPSTDYNLLGTYPQGTSLRILGKNSDASWLRVEAPDRTIGWMFAANLDLGRTLDGIDVAAAPAKPTAVPQPTTAPNPTNVAIQSSTWIGAVSWKKPDGGIEPLDSAVFIRVRGATIEYIEFDAPLPDCGEPQKVSWSNVPITNNSFARNGYPGWNLMSISGRFSGNTASGDAFYDVGNLCSFFLVWSASKQ